MSAPSQLALILRLPLPSLLPWSTVSLVGAATVLSYAMIAEHFPAELAARANGSLKVLHFGWAFLAQYGTGLILAQWTPQDGHYPTTAYQVAFGFSVAVQIVTLAWFVAPWACSLSWRTQRTFLRIRAGDERLVEPIIPSAEIAVFEACEGGDW